MRLYYEVTYRYRRARWDIGPRRELVGLVKSGRIAPCRAIDLGSGTASNCVFLAQHGFDVTGIDYAASAIELGRARARDAGVSVDFVQDDLTNLSRVTGTFGLLVDYGTLDDLVPKHRDGYVRSVLPLTHPRSHFLLFCLEFALPGWERLLLRLGVFGASALEPGEVDRRFGPHFDIERIGGNLDYSRWPPGYAVYLMTRKG